MKRVFPIIKCSMHQFDSISPPLFVAQKNFNLATELTCPVKNEIFRLIHLQRPPCDNVIRKVKLTNAQIGRCILLIKISVTRS